MTQVDRRNRPRAADVLVVDDEDDICRNLADILGDLGYHVDTALDGSAALALARSNHYDIALLDLKMPGMDGLTLYRELRKLRSDAVALIVTAFAEPGTVAEAQSAGVWQVLPKPVNLPVLLDLLGQTANQPLVLVVDDDHDLCASLRDLLRDRGYRVSVAHDERQATESLRQRSFSVVLIDMKLPFGDGGSVFRSVRESNPQARTLVITGHRSEMDPMVRDVLAEGANAVCYKPFDVPNLLDVIRRLTQEVA